MTKTGPLSKAEKFYIENKYPEGTTVDDLAKELDRTKKSIKNFVQKNEIQKPKKSETVLSQQFANNNKGSIVMTPNASVMADEMRPSFNQNKSSRRACITKIRDE
tara:strand:- start:7489 stop:7803 length:315 start_codon:yes stop_codon:yes gene_type:complete